MAALREAALKPRVIRQFLEKYDGNKLPSEAIGLNVLEEMGVPMKARERAYKIILSNAEEYGLVKRIKDIPYVDLSAAVEQPVRPIESNVEPRADDMRMVDADMEVDFRDALTPPRTVSESPMVTGRVFITHGKDKSVIDQLKELLTFGGFVPVVSVEGQTVAKSIADKVLDDMRSCSAAIVHVGQEERYLDGSGNEHGVLNSNVLIEIGIALALYGRNFILLVEKGTQLPSNLQGLYEVRYDGGKLDYEATMDLLRAFNGFKKTI